MTADQPPDTSGPITVAIVDDEPLARENLRLLLRGHPEFVVIGEAGDGVAATSLLERHRPAMVFLDVQMPLGGGFDVLARLQAAGTDVLPLVVFVTAFDEFALRAFDAHALDYLLKPIDDRRFATALARAKRRLGERRTAGLDERIRAALAGFAAAGAGAQPTHARTSSPASHPGPPLPRLMARHDGRTKLLRIDEVAWVEADGVYVRIHTASGASRTRGSLSGVVAQLGAYAFVRVHRRAVVNVDFVREVRDLRFGDGEIVLRTGETIRLSRRWRPAVERALLEARTARTTSPRRAGVRDAGPS